MTEEFNELAWKKKITDPRVPMSERLYGTSVIGWVILFNSVKIYIKNLLYISSIFIVNGKQFTRFLDILIN